MAYIYICMYICSYVKARTYLYVYIYIYVYTHTYMHSSDGHRTSSRPSRASSTQVAPHPLLGLTCGGDTTLERLNMRAHQTSKLQSSEPSLKLAPSGTRRGLRQGLTSVRRLICPPRSRASDLPLLELPFPARFLGLVLA